jgi:hypothetical protein
MAYAPLLTEAEAAAFLGLTASALKKRRLDGRPLLPFYPLHDGPRAPIRYKPADVYQYIDSRRRAAA